MVKIYATLKENNQICLNKESYMKVMNNIYPSKSLIRYESGEDYPLEQMDLSTFVTFVFKENEEICEETFEYESNISYHNQDKFQDVFKNGNKTLYVIYGYEVEAIEARETHSELVETKIPLLA
ncbi:hypothetical protein [Bacillus thuringiensis]|uniref:Uncharacterized protein n=1 Tax=Bacillus thuringiensis TaxID=1428 RepID=A0A9X6WIZ8_BACTU|nr:hypothetical protein [Bacillus thuringiensis]PFJ31839.1 hypothetical protein COJ15_29510 [Bacillus thuringiensis]